MGNPFVGEIKIFGGNFAPAGWAFCNGQLVPISENEALFSLIGTTYGGDGATTFALPDLRGRLPLHQGSGPGLSNYAIGQSGGSEQVTLLTSQIPSHNHPLPCKSTGGTQTGPANASWASSSANSYQTGVANTLMNGANIGPNSGGQSHNNIMPYLAVSFIISLFGIYPSPN